MKATIGSTEQPPAEYFLAPDDPDFEEPFFPITFPQPEDRSSVVWRYMSFAKFLSLLDRKALFFARLDKLGDPFEGSITEVQRALRKQLEKKGPVLHDTSATMIKSKRENTIVNCWHMKDYESISMWERYVTGYEGIAICSTYERLESSFDIYDGRERQRNKDGTDLQLFVRIGMVKYIHYDRDEGDIEQLSLLKRREFEDEREVRAVVLDRSYLGDPHPTRFPTGGDYVPVDLTELVEAVYVAPGAPEWFRRTVQSIVERFVFHFPIRRSNLDGAPIY